MATQTLNITAAQSRTWNAIFESLSLFSDFDIKQHAEIVITPRSRKTLAVTFETEFGLFYKYHISTAGAIIGMTQVEDFDGEHIQGFPL